MDKEQNIDASGSLDSERSVIGGTPLEQDMEEGSESLLANGNHAEAITVGSKETGESMVEVESQSQSLLADMPQSESFRKPVGTKETGESRIESQSQSLLANMSESENFLNINGSEGTKETRVESQSQSLLADMPEEDSFGKTPLNTNNSEDLFRSVDETGERPKGSTKDLEMTEIEPQQISQENLLSEVEEMDQDEHVVNNTVDPGNLDFSEHAQNQEELEELLNDHVPEELETSENAQMDDIDEDGGGADSEDEDDENTVAAIQLPLSKIGKIMKICLNTNEEEDSPPIENPTKEQGKKRFGKGKGKSAKNAVGGSTNNMLVSKEAIYLAAAAAELFIASATQLSSRITTSTKKKTVTVDHLKRAVSDSESYEFLQGCFQPSIIIGD